MNILGISTAHDSTVALYKDNELKLFFKEERLSRSKRDKFPFLSLLKIKENFKEPIDVAIISHPTNGDSWLVPIKSFIEKVVNPKVILDWSDKHHLAHASLAFYNSGFDKASVIVIDRNGSIVGDAAREAETIFLAEYPSKFTPVYKNYWSRYRGDSRSFMDQRFQKIREESPQCEFHYYNNYSITKVYESATTLIGQHKLENGKTMGLSAYGEDIGTESLFHDNFSKDDLFEKLPDDSVIKKDYIEKINKNITKDNYKLYADYAYKVQRETEVQVANLVRKSIEKTGIKNICITGGYGLNVVCNGYLLDHFPDVNFYFEPLADDSGNSLGVAMLYYREVTQDLTISKIKDTFTHGIKQNVPDIDSNKYDLDKIASLILNNKSIALYNDLAESGPRSLGNRSILYNALNKKAKDNINVIKKREWYRPFAASVLEEDAEKYFMMPVDSSPFMTISFKVKDEYKELLSGVMHVDGSCRIQTVANNNSPLRLLLEELKKQSGHGIVLNTSFNLAGEPLVETVDDALNVLNNSELDYVWFAETKSIVSKGDL